MRRLRILVTVVGPYVYPSLGYELRNGLTPADYTMSGSPGGLARIDAIFHSNGYTIAFSNAPVVFGAFPSLHAANATIAALFISHFWPRLRYYAWGYSGILYWATMYLTHHYLIDVVGGACLAIAMFYLMMPASLRFPDNTTNTNFHPVANGRSKYDEYDLESNGRTGGVISPGADSQSDNDDPPNPLAPLGNHSRRPSSPFPSSPRSAVLQKGGGRNHRHTASIASLIRSDERVEDGWGYRSLVAPQPQPLHPGNGAGREGPERSSVPFGGNANLNTLLKSPPLEKGDHTARARSPSWPDRREPA